MQMQNSTLRNALTSALVVGAVAAFSAPAAHAQGYFGGFAPNQTTFTTSFAGPIHVGVGDLNGDGFPDIAATSNNGNSGNSTLFIVLNDGAGGFGGAQQTFPMPGPFTTANAAQIGDINGDGFNDVVAESTREIFLFIGNGAGGFSSSSSFPTDTAGGLLRQFSLSRGPQSPRLVDMNGDGALDIVGMGIAAIGVTNNNLSSFMISFGDGAGGFSAVSAVRPPLPSDPNGNGGSLFSFAVDDVNGDGVPDMVGSGTVNGVNGIVVTVGIGDGAGGFSFLPNIALPTAGRNSVGLGDLNGDGFIDFAFTKIGVATIALGDGTGAFNPSTITNFALAQSIGFPDLKIRDINADGFPDLVGADGFAKLDVLLGDGTGALSAVQQFNTGDNAGGSTAGSVLVDVNGDGGLDFVASTSNGFVVNFNCVSTPDINGDGFVNATDLAYVLGQWGTAASTVDLNCSGVVDSGDLSKLLSNWGIFP